MKAAIYTHEDCLGHNAGRGHPESPARLRAVLDALELAFPRTGAAAGWKEAPMGTDAQVLRCHTPAYLERLKKISASLAPGDAPVNIDTDTRMSHGSLRAALRGVGAVCGAVDDIYEGRVRRAFCAVRPPGHHAMKGDAMGFSMFGNAAIAAAHALAKPGVRRVAIVDFDVHHGNGTEDLVRDNPDILFFSMHQVPLWPYYKSGEGGRHGTAGNVHNIAVPVKADPQFYRDTFDRQIIPRVIEFAPDFIILSAGFDAHRDDPPLEDHLFNDPPGRQMLVEADFDWMTRRLLQAAEACCKGRFVSVLEGGYNTAVLASCAVSHVRTLAEAD